MNGFTVTVIDETGSGSTQFVDENDSDQDLIMGVPSFISNEINSHKTKQGLPKITQHAIS